MTKDIKTKVFLGLAAFIAYKAWKSAQINTAIDGAINNNPNLF